MGLVYGVGVNDRSKPAKINGKITKEYGLWCGMLKRCFCKEYQKRYPAYIGCEVSENFKNYSYFYDWCQNQIGFGNDGWHLDKDIIVKGNKEYSESKCCFIPSDINCMMVGSKAIRGNYPVGVTLRDGKIASQIKIRGKKIFLGYFENSLDAFYAYKNEKEKIIIYTANKFKDMIDERVYKSLISYNVSIHD